MTRDELDSLEPGDRVLDLLYGSIFIFDSKLENETHPIYRFNVDDPMEYWEVCSKCDQERLQDLVLEASCQAAKAFDKDLKDLLEDEDV